MYDIARAAPPGAEAEPQAAARANVAAYEQVKAVAFEAKAVDTLLKAFAAGRP